MGCTRACRVHVALMLLGRPACPRVWWVGHAHVLFFAAAAQYCGVLAGCRLPLQQRYEFGAQAL